MSLRFAIAYRENSAPALASIGPASNVTHMKRHKKIYRTNPEKTKPHRLFIIDAPGKTTAQLIAEEPWLLDPDVGWLTVQELEAMHATAADSPCIPLSDALALKRKANR